MPQAAPGPAPTTPPDGTARRDATEPVERESVAGEEDPGAGSDVPANDASPAADNSTRPEPGRR